LEDGMGLMQNLIGGGKQGLEVGETAPDFTLNDQDGQPVTLSSFRGQKNVIVYFYPKDDTPGCTKESCSFRDQFAVFTDLGAEVFGISADSEASHKAFATKYRLPFRLLSDHGAKVRKAFKVPTILGLMSGRVTFVIDKQGVVRHVFNSQTNALKHVDEALDTLKSLTH
jgi:peroxiredoxin Q/BCP